MVLQLKRINHMTVNAPSGEEEKIRSFYGQALGLEEVTIPNALIKVYEIIWYKLSDILLHIEFTKNFVRPPDNFEGAIMPGRHIAIEVAHIDDFKSQLIAQNADVREAVAIPDRKRFYLVDPFGNFLEIIEFNADIPVQTPIHCCVKAS